MQSLQFIESKKNVVQPLLQLLCAIILGVWVALWCLSGGYEAILSELFYIGNVLPLQWAQLTKTVNSAQLAREFVFVFFELHDLSLCLCMFCFTLDS